MPDKYKTYSTVIMVGDRYFSHFGPKNICFAWSLSGAKLFAPWKDHTKIIEKLKKRGYKPVFVGVVSQIAQI